jgi:hypothetical protein
MKRRGTMNNEVKRAQSSPGLKLNYIFATAEGGYKETIKIITEHYSV